MSLAFTLTLLLMLVENAKDALDVPYVLLFTMNPPREAKLMLKMRLWHPLITWYFYK